MHSPVDHLRIRQCQSDLDAFYKMMQLVESDYQNGLPYHITSPLSSLFRIFQCNPLSDAVAAKWLSEGCVLQDVPQGCIEFDRTTLQELFGKCNNIHMIGT